MSDIKIRIRELSATAASLSQKAMEAFKQRDFVTGKQLMARAVVASKDCQRLIKEREKVG